MTVKYDGEIFEGADEVTLAMLWWLVHLLGGKVVISQEEAFWDTNLPFDRSLVMYKENDQVILAAERLDSAG